MLKPKMHIWDHIRGMCHAKRALEVALVGGFRPLLIGPPGNGKTALLEGANEVAGLLTFYQNKDLTTQTYPAIL